jgi:HEAT repeat protein
MKRLLACCLLLLLGTALPGQDRPPTPPPNPNPLVPMPPGTGRADFKELVPALLDALKDHDADVRQAAASALAGIGRQALEPLLDVLKDKDQSKEMRANAAYVLGQMGHNGQEALPALTKALKDDDKEVRRRAAFAIQRIVKDMNAGGGMMGAGMMPGMPMMGGGSRPASSDIKVPDPGLLAPSATKPAETTKPESTKPKETKEEKKEEKK